MTRARFSGGCRVVVGRCQVVVGSLSCSFGWLSCSSSGRCRVVVVHTSSLPLFLCSILQHVNINVTKIA